MRSDHDSTPECYFENVSERGNENTPSKLGLGWSWTRHTMDPWSARKIVASETVGNWYAEFFMPNTTDYKLNDVFYVDVLSGDSVDVKTARTNLQKPLTLHKSTGAAFINVNSKWNYIGIYSV